MKPRLSFWFGRLPRLKFIIVGETVMVLILVRFFLYLINDYHARKHKVNLVLFLLALNCISHFKSALKLVFSQVQSICIKIKSIYLSLDVIYLIYIPYLIFFYLYIPNNVFQCSFNPIILCSFC